MSASKDDVAGVVAVDDRLKEIVAVNYHGFELDSYDVESPSTYLRQADWAMLIAAACKATGCDSLTKEQAAILTAPPYLATKETNVDSHEKIGADNAMILGPSLLAFIKTAPDGAYPLVVCEAETRGGKKVIPGGAVHFSSIVKEGAGLSIYDSMPDIAGEAGDMSEFEFRERSINANLLKSTGFRLSYRGQTGLSDAQKAANCGIHAAIKLAGQYAGIDESVIDAEDLVPKIRGGLKRFHEARLREAADEDLQAIVEAELVIPIRRHFRGLSVGDSTTRALGGLSGAAAAPLAAVAVDVGSLSAGGSAGGDVPGVGGRADFGAAGGGGGEAREKEALKAKFSGCQRELTDMGIDSPFITAMLASLNAETPLVEMKEELKNQIAIMQAMDGAVASIIVDNFRSNGFLEVIEFEEEPGARPDIF